MSEPTSSEAEIGRLLSELPPEVRPVLGSLLNARATASPTALAYRVRLYRARLEAAAEVEPLMDIGAGRQVAAICLEMLRGLGEQSRTLHLRLAQAAVDYFAKDDDAVSHSASVIGIDDDLKVVRAVARVLGSP